MISRILLRDFARFHNTEFDFGATTVFFGANEAGKTTVFDALFQELCSPKANKRYGRDLRNRYGEHREAELEFSGPAEAYDEDAFMQLHAIRSGDVALTLSDSATWMNRVKASLFTGGIDPGRLVERFDTLASTKGTLGHNKRLKELEDLRSSLRRRMDSLQAQRQDILSRQERVEQLGAEIDRLEARQRELEQVMAHQEQALEQERRIRRKADLRKVAQVAQEEEAARARLSELRVFRQEDLKELDELQRRLEAKRSEHQLARHDAHAQAAQRQQAAAALTETEGKAERLDAQSRVAGELTDSLNRLRRDPPTVRKPAVKPLFVALAVVAVAAGVIAAFVLQDPLLRSGAAFAGITVGLLLFFLVGFRYRTVTDAAALGRELDALRDSWRNRVPDGPALQSTTVDGLFEELQLRRMAADQAANERTESRQALAEQELREQKAREVVETSRQAVAQAEAALASWLSRRGLNSRDDLVTQLSNKQLAKREAESLAQQLNELVTRYEVQDVAELRAYADRHLKALDEEGVPSEGRSETEQRRLRTQVASLQQELKGVQENRAQKAAQLHREQGEIAGSLGNLPDEIAETERRLRTVDRDVRQIRLDREAPAMARDIFQAIDRDSEAILDSLAREIGALFGELVPEVREVRIPSLREDALSLQDAGGTVRPVPHLSHGTQHAFALGARLILAERATEQPGVLVLDEPFHALDVGRMERALRLLRRFQEQNDFQLVLFTKDDQLVEAAESVFGAPVVHRL